MTLAKMPSTLLSRALRRCGIASGSFHTPAILLTHPPHILPTSSQSNQKTAMIPVLLQFVSVIRLMQPYMIASIQWLEQQVMAWRRWGGASQVRVKHAFLTDLPIVLDDLCVPPRGSRHQKC